MWDVVVIGAGIAGLTAARQLHQNGYRVLVMEKSRGLGGRLATRRVDGQPVDHGCRFLSPLPNNSSGLIPALLSAEILQPWQPWIFELSTAGELNPQIGVDPYYVAPLGMTSVAKFLAEELTIYRQWRVTHLGSNHSTWHLQAEAPQGLSEPVEAKAVIAAIPAPQLLPLVRQLKPDIETSPLGQSLGQVQFDPVITVMAGYGPAAEHPFGVTPKEMPQLRNPGWMVLGENHNTIRWAGLDSSKRHLAAQSVVVLHSAAAFAAHFLDVDDLSRAGRALIEAAAPLLGNWLATPGWIQTHRWRYGFVKRPCANQPPFSTALPGFAACGDWCIGPNAEAAFHSGQKAAAAIMQTLL